MPGRRISVDKPAPAPAANPRGSVVAVVVIAAVCCFALCAYWFQVVVPAPLPGEKASGDLISTVYDPPTSSVESALDRGDGQLFAAQAMDPSAAHPEVVRGGPAEQAYRYQRPLYGWIGWAASAGQPGAVGWALVAATAASVVALIALCASWLARRGSDPRWALVLLATPGVFVDLTWVGPEALGTALVLFGLARWIARSAEPDRPSLVPASIDVVALAAFALAGLTRESLLIVPVVLGVAAVVRRSWAVAFALGAAVVPYAAWVVVLHARVGSWPKGAVPGRISAIPLRGLVDALPSWGAGDYLFAVALVGLAIAALVLGAGSPLRPLVAVHLAFAAILGEPVWIRFADFGRVLLPMTVFSMLIVVPALAARRVRAPERTVAEPDGSPVPADTLAVAR